MKTREETAAQRVRSYAAQLARGERITDKANHYKAMAELKAQLGDPRPAGMTLSLVRPESPSIYEGRHTVKGRRVPYHLSNDPDDYAWETFHENILRRGDVLCEPR